MKYQELEVKLLGVNKESIINKLEKIGAIYKGTRIQKIYTYDCYEPILMYKLAVEDYRITKSKNSLKKILNVISYIKPIFTENDKNIINETLCGKEFEEYFEQNVENIEVDKLLNQKLLIVIENTKNRFFKWIRLREDGEKIELTAKYIYNSNAEYQIDDVKEIEILVDDFENANKLVEEMGYYKKKLVEKKRTSYIYEGLQIEIDEWPLLDPYVEIEGKNVDSIYELAEKLGYLKEQVKVMNTEDVYLKSGIDLNKYEIMTFNYQQLK